MRPWAPRVMGLDLSLTGTGVAVVGGSGVEVLRTVRAGKLTGHARLDLVLAAIDAADRGANLDLVVIEGPSYGNQGDGKRQRGHHERAGLWWIVAHGLYRSRRPYAVASPAARAKYATGDGRANKAAVLAAVRELYADLAAPRNDNEADALVLAAMGVDRLGGELVEVPPRNREALRRVQWPQTPADEGDE